MCSSSQLFRSAEEQQRHSAIALMEFLNGAARGGVVETPVQARQGVLDRPVLVVLIVRVMLAMAALAASYFIFFAR
jgi:hypothetical protein